jgi:hypothetical protein
MKDTVGNAPRSVDNKGNGIGATQETNILKKLGKAVDITQLDGRSWDNMNPSKMHFATTFDIEIYQKYSNVAESAPSGILGRLAGMLTGAKPNGATKGVAKIRNCRITRADFAMTKKSAARETYQFVALYADEDSFIADFSGVGQQFAQ